MDPLAVLLELKGERYETSTTLGDFLSVRHWGEYRRCTVNSASGSCPACVPWLIFLACPLMHLFIHRHLPGHHHGKAKGTDSLRVF